MVNDNDPSANPTTKKSTKRILSLSLATAGLFAGAVSALGSAPTPVAVQPTTVTLATSGRIAPPQLVLAHAANSSSVLIAQHSSHSSHSSHGSHSSHSSHDSHSSHASHASRL